MNWNESKTNWYGGKGRLSRFGINICQVKFLDSRKDGQSPHPMQIDWQQVPQPELYRLVGLDSNPQVLPGIVTTDEDLHLQSQVRASIGRRRWVERGAIRVYQSLFPNTLQDRVSAN